MLVALCPYAENLKNYVTESVTENLFSYANGSNTSVSELYLRYSIPHSAFRLRTGEDVLRFTISECTMDSDSNVANDITFCVLQYEPMVHQPRHLHSNHRNRSIILW